MTDINLVNNLWVLICGLLIFSMTVSVGLLEVGEIGERYTRSILKSLLIMGSALYFMAFIGFNTAFAPTLGGIIGNPLYSGGVFLVGSRRPRPVCSAGCGGPQVPLISLPALRLEHTSSLRPHPRP